MAVQFDLALSYPQWQGSGRHENLPRGAEATAEICGRYAPLVTVPISVGGEYEHGVQRWSAVFDQVRAAQSLLSTHQPERLLTAGGDCAVDVVPIDYLSARYRNLTVIWIDTHFDANTPATSPSGNLHGMPVTAIMGFAPGPIQALLTAPLDPAHFFYYGVRIGDEGDRAFQREHALQLLDPDKLPTGPIHIHFDLDVLDPGAFPHLAYGEPGGLRIDQATDIVHRIGASGDLVGLTITEFAPADVESAEAGKQTISALCEAAGAIRLP